MPKILFGLRYSGPYTTFSWGTTPGISSSSSLPTSLYHLVRPGICCFWMRLIISSAQAVPFTAFRQATGRTPFFVTMPATSAPFNLMVANLIAVSSLEMMYYVSSSASFTSQMRLFLTVSLFCTYGNIPSHVRPTRKLLFHNNHFLIPCAAGLRPPRNLDFCVYFTYNNRVFYA